jgi:carboxymethylenebutenolidase
LNLNSNVGGRHVSELIRIPSPGVPLFWGEPGDPVVVVIHDWYGRLPGLDAFAGSLAAEGLRVAVPDLFNGVASVSPHDAEQLAADLDVGIALAEIDDIIANARLEGSQRVAVVGFSMGGWLALLHAQGGSADAVVAYYASLGPKDHGVIPSPVMLHLAETDEWTPDEEPNSFIARLKEHGTPITDHTYLDTVHSFANASISERHNARASELAHARTRSFLASHLLD